MASDPDFRKKANIFLDAALQTHIWGDVIEREKFINEKIFSLPAFFKEPIFRTEGMPKYGVINKWKTNQKGESIKVDLALIQIFNSGTLINGSVQSELPSHQQALENYIQSGIQQLNAQGSVQLKYNQAVDNINNLQGNRIIIIPFIRNDGLSDPKLKTVNANIGGGVYHYSFGMIGAETVLEGMVRFTPDNLGQVDGYFIPDKDNNIVASVCYINVINSEAMQKSYINECLLRSLGFPEISQSPDNMLSVRKVDSKIELTQNDYDMLKWLYSLSIKAGDDKYEVIKQLNAMR